MYTRNPYEIALDKNGAIRAAVAAVFHPTYGRSVSRGTAVIHGASGEAPAKPSNGAFGWRQP